jgi:hypothetical protein
MDQVADHRGPRPKSLQTQDIGEATGQRSPGAVHRFNICADCGDPYDKPGLLVRCRPRQQQAH